MTDTRDTLRGLILGTARKPRAIQVQFFDATIELRQPTLGEVLDNQSTDNRKLVLVQMLIARAYVPGTDQHVFEAADESVLLALPFGADFVRLNKALEDLSEVNFLDKKPDSDEVLLN